MQNTINERLKFLIDSLKMSARAFSAQLEVPESNTRNYLDKTTKLNSDYLERISRNFKSVNLSWLITGEGEPFLSTEAPESHTSASHNKKISRSLVVGHVAGNATQNQGSEPQTDKDALIEQLRSQLLDKERTIQLLLNQLPKP